MQLTFGIIVLRTSTGKMVFSCIGEKINTFLAFTNAGTEMVFGYLATGVLKGPSGNITINLGTDSQAVNGTILDLPMPVQNTIFAFSSMPVVIFFSFFVSILYFYGVMQAVVKQLGWVLQSTIGTTPRESISASGNIFLGMVSFWTLCCNILGTNLNHIFSLDRKSPSREALLAHHDQIGASCCVDRRLCDHCRLCHGCVH